MNDNGYLADVERILKELAESHKQEVQERKAWEARREEWDVKQQAKQEAWQAKRDEWQAESNKRLRRMEISVDQTNKAVASLTDRLGLAVESMVKADLARFFTELIPECTNQDEVVVYQRVKRRLPRKKIVQGQKGMIEFDGVADWQDYVIFNESKNNFTANDVDKFIEDLGQVRLFFPEYEDYRIIGAISALHVDRSVQKYAMRQGLLVLSMKEGLMEIQNEPGFKWREF